MAWTFAARTATLVEGAVIGVECRGRRLAVYRLKDEYFATADACPHQGGALSAGCVVEGFIECPVHYALFDIRTGAADGAVTAKSVTTYPTRVENEEIHVDLDA
ncbi:MAG TPA: Rieske 2Fe-2S domain-containing protein [Vicinamibacterales bacterium]|nr:Rieske 2Fe-2S domain-containing protein [Vicinamibacterales bacterium]